MTEHDPTTCHVCGRQAVGIGIGDLRDPKWICAECVPLIDYIKSARRPTAYEIKAREGGMEAAAPLVKEYGPDLSEWTEDQVLMFVGACWRGTADRIRDLIRNQEAPW
jgi:hypothetical protein